MGSHAERWISPLRYPGGKGRMAPYLASLFADQSGLMDIEVWVEPFAGGAGAGLALLEAGAVCEVWLTEKHPAIAAFWRALISDTESFAARVERTVPDLDLWDWATHALTLPRGDLSDGDFGYAAFIVNRCSRSGIIHSAVGPIGGKRQTGRYTLADRFNGPGLANRIRRVTPLASHMRVAEGDATQCITDLDGSGVEHEVFLFVDPPYIREGNMLYTNGMTQVEHQGLADALNACPAPWLLTYDDEPCVATDLYPHCRVLEFDIAHTAHKQRVDREYAVFSNNCQVNPLPQLLPTGRSQWLDQNSALTA